MGGPPNPGLLGVLDRLALTPAERRLFLRADTAATVWKVGLLTATAVYLNTSGVSDFGGRLGATRGMELVEQVVGAAFQTFGGEDPHPGAFAKAAMLLRGITAGHPFEDGNKRTGFLLAAYYLQQVGHPVPDALSITGVVALCRRVSRGDVRDVDEITAALERLWRPSLGAAS